MTAMGPPWAYRRFLAEEKVMQKCVKYLKEYSEPSETGIPEQGTEKSLSKKSEIAPWIFVLENMISTEAFAQELKVDVFWQAPGLVVKEISEEAQSIPF